jgi:C-terminal processing protease CtpA/Prc
LTLGDPKIRLGIVRIPEFESNYRKPCLDAWKRSDVWDQQGKLNRGALRRAVDQSWYAILADLLGKFKAAGVTAVLVDIGNNSGGGDSGDIAARLFTAIRLHSSSLWMSQEPSSSTRYFDEQIATLRHALEFDPESRQAQESLSWFTKQKEQLAQSCPMDWVWRERRAWGSETCRRIVEAGSAGGPLPYLAAHTVADVRVAQRLHWPAAEAQLWATWTGPVYVLTDKRTYSAAEMFAAVLQNNRAAKTVGAQTGGDGCGFMNSTEPLVLPTSGLRFRVPNCVRMRADGTDEVAGVMPDVPVPSGEGEEPATRAQRVVDQVYADLKRSPSTK